VSPESRIKTDAAQKKKLRGGQTAAGVPPGFHGASPEARAVRVDLLDSVLNGYRGERMIPVPQQLGMLHGVDRDDPDAPAISGPPPALGSLKGRLTLLPLPGYSHALPLHESIAESCVRA
jgi:hypothetical protein